MKVLPLLSILLVLACAPLFATMPEATPTLHLTNVDNQEDAGIALRTLIQQAAAAQQPTVISIPKGTYHFYPDSAPEQAIFISNHDQQPAHRIGIPLQGLKDVNIQGNGSTFIFHGKMLPVVVMDSERITISGINIAVDAPLAHEGTVVETTPDSVTLQFSTTPAWGVENGKFYIYGKGWKLNPNHALGFEASGPMLSHGLWGDMGWRFPAEKVGKDCVKFHTSTAVQKYGLKKGNILVLRNAWRPHPGMLLYRAKDTVLNDVVFHDSMGMALIAQRSENIRISGGGCLRAPGRIHTTAADATHFSNCRGHISVQGATYEAMMDDAINVHATCLGITEVESPRTFIARYMHGQAYGFEVMEPGEQLQFIHGPTLELNPQLRKVEKVEVIDPRHVRVTLTEDMPAGIGVGDAIENADWHPSVDFSYNTVRHNRARGALFTTPKPVRVIGNHFDHTHGSAILLAGDAQGWYESGACQDVLIKDNVFRHGLTGLYQFTDALIAICPEVRKPSEQKQRYHRNVRITGNHFITHRVPLLSAISAEDVDFTGNKIEYHDIYPAQSGGRPWLLKEACGTMKLQETK